MLTIRSGSSGQPADPLLLVGLPRGHVDVGQVQHLQVAGARREHRERGEPDGERRALDADAPDRGRPAGDDRGPGREAYGAGHVVGSPATVSWTTVVGSTCWLPFGVCTRRGTGSRPAGSTVTVVFGEGRPGDRRQGLRERCPDHGRHGPVVAGGGVVGVIGAGPELVVRSTTVPLTTDEPAAGSVETTEPDGTVSEEAEPPVFAWKPAASSAAFASVTVLPETSGTWIFWP